MASNVATQSTSQRAPRWYRIGEVARLLDEKTHVLRFWEAEFRCIRPSKSRSGQRVYSDKDVELLREIKRLLKEERFTIEGARRHLGLTHAENTLQHSINSHTAQQPLWRSLLVELRIDAANLLEQLETTR